MKKSRFTESQIVKISSSSSIVVLSIVATDSCVKKSKIAIYYVKIRFV